MLAFVIHSPFGSFAVAATDAAFEQVK